MKKNYWAHTFSSKFANNCRSMVLSGANCLKKISKLINIKMQLLKHCVIFLRTGTKRTRNVSIGHGCPRYMRWLCFNKRPITPSKISGSVFWYYISTYQIWIKSMQSFKSYWADTKFRTDGRTNGRTNARTHARTGVTLNAPPPFFEWRGHKHQNKSNLTPNSKRSADTKALFLYCDVWSFFLQL